MQAPTQPSVNGQAKSDRRRIVAGDWEYFLFWLRVGTRLSHNDNGGESQKAQRNLTPNESSGERVDGKLVSPIEAGRVAGDSRLFGT